MAWNPLSSYSNTLASSLAEQAESLREQLFGGSYTARLIQEQMEAATRSLASPWLARDADLYATRIGNIQHLIDEAQRPSRLLTEQLRRYEEEHLATIRSLTSQFEEPLLRAQRDIDQWRESVLASSLVSRSSLFDTGASSLTEQLLAGMGAIGGSSLARELERTISGLDLDTIYGAAQGVADRLWDALPDDLDSADEFEEAVSDSQLEAFRNVVQEEVGKAVAQARDASNAATALTWRLFYIGLVLTLLEILVPLVIQSLTEKLPQPSTVQSRPNEARPSTTRGGVVVAVRETAMHLGPSTRQPVVASVHARQFAVVVRRQHGWLLVEHVPPEGHSVAVRGWVRVRHTRPMEAEVTRLLWCALTEAPQPGMCSDS